MPVERVAPPAVGSPGLVRRRNVWVTCLGLFCFNYAFYFLLTWLPSYLVKERRFSLRAMAIYGALPFCATAVTSLAGGAWADHRIRQGSNAGPLRKKTAIAGLILCAVMLTVAARSGTTVGMVSLILAFVGIGLFTCNVWAITQTLAGPHLAGAWTGWQNAVGNMGGVAAPILTGWGVSASGSFFSAFAIASGMLVLAALFYGAIIERAEEERHYNRKPGLR
jgi:MFS family permease